MSRATRLTNRPKGDIRHLKSIFSYLRPYRALIVGASIALVLGSSSVLGMGWGVRFLVDDGLHKGNGELLDQAFLILMGMTLLMAAASYARFYMVSLLGERVMADIRNDLYKKLTGMHIGYFEITRTGELLSRLTTDTTLLQTVIGSSVSMAARNTLLFVGGLILLLVTSTRLTLYVLVLAPVVVAPIILIGRKVRLLARETQARMADVNAHAEESVNAIRTIQSLALEPQDREQFSRCVDLALNTSLARVRKRSAMNAIVISLVFGAVVTVIWIGGKDALAGRITTGELASFVFYSVVVSSAVGAITEMVADLQRAAGAAERIFELLALTSDIQSPAHPETLPDLAQAQVAFEQVNFSYPTRRDKAAIEDFTLNVEPGKTVALVGPSGAGKTTVFQLLLRFYDPDSGVVRLNGMDIRKVRLEDIRHIIGLVPQDPVIFSTSARENIRLGRTGASDADIEQAARAACAYEFIEKLPEGFDTYLGEKGVRLSGGQRQRVAIARALVRDPKLLLLDEATSALDSENEHLIQQALEKLMQGRTTFVIAHRLSTIMKADKIVLMNEGRIEATGTHQQLQAKSSLYARLVELQFKTAA